MNPSQMRDMADLPTDPFNLMVNYIPTAVRDDDLHDIFSEFGEIESARVIRDRQTHEPKGYGFVKFKDADCARRACDALNGFEILTKRLKVTVAKQLSHFHRAPEPTVGVPPPITTYPMFLPQQQISVPPLSTQPVSMQHVQVSAAPFFPQQPSQHPNYGWYLVPMQN